MAGMGPFLDTLVSQRSTIVAMNNLKRRERINFQKVGGFHAIWAVSEFLKSMMGDFGMMEAHCVVGCSPSTRWHIDFELF